MLVAYNKPWGVLSQFTRECEGQRTLAEFGFPKGLWPIGRLDRDSEGLLLLGDEKRVVDQLLNPRRGHGRTYTVQVEGDASPEQLAALARGGLDIRGHVTLPCRAVRLPGNPGLAEREPPVRFRKSVPDCWLELTLSEGKNRQVRRMTAAVGLPTLRLVRTAIGRLELGRMGLGPGEWRELTAQERRLALG